MTSIEAGAFDAIENDDALRALGQFQLEAEALHGGENVGEGRGIRGRVVGGRETRVGKATAARVGEPQVAGIANSSDRSETSAR